MRLADLFVSFKATGLSTVAAKTKALGGTLARTSLRANVATASVNILTGAMKRLAAVAAMVKRVMMTVFKVFAVFAGIVTGLAIKAAVDFEKQMAMVSTMLDEVGMKRMPEFSAGIKALSVEFGQATDTMSKGLYDILSASIDPAKAMDVLRVATKAAVGGFTDTANAADALTTILNSYQMDASDAAHISDMLFATVKRGKLTYEQLAGSIGKVAATAAIAGLSLEEMLAAISTITRAGIKSDQAMTAVVGVMRAFLKPEAKGAELAKSLGLEMSSATLKADGLVGVFKKLNGLTADQLALLFPNIRGLKGVAAAMQDQAGFLKDVNMMYNANGMAQEAFAKASNTTSFQLSRMKQAFVDVMERMGKGMLPTVKALASGFVDLTGRLRELYRWISPVWEAFKGMWKAIFNLTGGASALGGALMKIIKSLKNFLIQFYTTMTVGIENLDIVWDTMKASAELALRSMWEGFKFLFTDQIPYVMKWYIKHFGEIMSIQLSILYKYAAAALTAITDLNLQMWEVMKAWAPKIWEGFKNSFKDTLAAIPVAFKFAVEGLKKIWDFIWSGGPVTMMQPLIDSIREGLKNGPEIEVGGVKIKTKKVDLTDEMKRLAALRASFKPPVREQTQEEKDLRARITKNIDTLKGLISKKITEAFVPATIDAFKEIFERLKKGSKNLIDLAKHGGSSLLKSTFPFLYGKKEAPAAAAGPKVKFDSGSWKGLANVWQDIQSAIMKDDPLLKENEKQTKLLKSIDKKIGGPALAGK